jgi:glycosyltransferase involved in cell wall biosynthesis
MLTQMDFTIVTPSLNYGRFIGECLQSVAAQDGVTLEHLVLDAGSTDETAAVVARHPHAEFRQEPDKGMSDAINKGFRAAKGDWVMWLNADDRLKPGALAAVKAFAERTPDADVIYGGWDFVDENGKLEKRMTLFPFRRRMLSHLGCYIGSTACFFRRSTTIDQGHLLDVEFRYVMDGEYYNRLAAHGKRFACLPLVLADFRRHGDNLSLRNYHAADASAWLKLEKQWAESRAIRRAYGWSPFGSDALNGVTDAFLYYVFLIQKGVLKRLCRRGWREP